RVKTPGMFIDGVQLHERRSRHKAVEGVTCSAGTHLHIVNLVVQLEAVPLRDGRKAEMRIGMVSPTNAELIQGPVIVGAKSFKEAVNKRLAGIRTVGKLMPVKMIESCGNEYVFEDVERRGQSLDEVVEKIVIGVGAV